MKVIILPQELIDYIFEKSNFETCLKSQLCSLHVLKKVFLKEKWTKNKSIRNGKFNIYKYIIDNHFDKIDKKDVILSINNFRLFKYIYSNLYNYTYFDRLDYIDYIYSCNNNEIFKILVNESLSNYILFEDDIKKIKKLKKSKTQSKYLDLFLEY